jgi:cytochrome c nitrite reductase small subunit
MASGPRRKAVARLVPLVVAALAVVAPAVGAASQHEDVPPRPAGWLGTTADWAQGLGIAFVLVNLLLLALAWRGLRRGELGAAGKQMLFVCIVVLPLAVIFLGNYYGLEASRSVAACNACHVMNPYVQDLRNLQGESLAAVHYKNRYIQEDHCYTCRSDYGMTGTVKAKFDGLGHVWRYTTGTYTLPLKIASPYSNTRCLYCHAGSQKFLNSAGHPKEAVSELLAGNVSCLDCHAPAHAATKAASRRPSSGSRCSAPPWDCSSRWPCWCGRRITP